jgi:chromate transporter
LRLRGWRGAAVALAGFILPSMLLMIGFAILYRHLRHLPNTERLFHGLNAAVVALIVVTAWRMGRRTLNKRWQWALAVSACLAVAAFRATILEVILCAGLIGIYIDSFAERRWQRWRRIRRRAAARRAQLAELRSKNFVGGYLTRAMADERVRVADEVARTQLAADIHDTTSPDLIDHAPEPDDDGPPPRRPARGPKLRAVGIVAVAMPILAKLTLLVALAAIFLRIGAITFGGGFVMVPLIKAEVVENYHWLTQQEFADATALGQLTPGPVLITATFIGYRVAGTLGALVATVCVFLPAFIMTIAAGSYLRRFRANRQVQAFLRGVTPAVAGLLVAAAWSIGRAGIHTWMGVSIAILAALVLLRFRVNAIWIIFGAGALRLLLGVWFG